MELIIHAYTRAQALQDGVLIDVSQSAAQAGLPYPAAVTRTVWGRFVEVPEGVEAQDEVGRLWDIVSMLQFAIKRLPDRDRDEEIHFQLHVRNKNEAAELVTLKAICGPGDDLEPVITIMLPDED